MADTDKALQELEDLFAAARAERPAVPDRLSAAILEDAARELPGSRSAAPRRRARQPLWRQLAEAVGGWPALGGLAAASAAGLWIGIAPPSFVPDPVALAGYEDSSTTVPFDSYDMAMVLSEDLQ
ncbi:hypothetical protein RA19_21775 [Leisingera sp. ANG-M1]|uniref:hypothetical protein n=1 Tax=Leisingera sp. ANG-M1 TaxID=1577895 RepID=UPI00057FDD8D|nr:hypothetical protein [Leisingera sp. ANG-M1]KIC07764.1 hypothetical protein RA19_21775 [Leisingera sp. ANG-M1]